MSNKEVALSSPTRIQDCRTFCSGARGMLRRRRRRQIVFYWHAIVLFLEHPVEALSLHPPHDVRGIPVYCVPLHDNNAMTPSPYCLAVSSILNLPSTINFLATQVWPSARVAAKALEEYGGSIMKSDETTTICELGCGPGLPSLTAAAATSSWSQPCQVIATDIDDLALELVMAAAKEQGLESIISTRTYDLIAAEWKSEWMDDVDLFVMSDVFETEAIAKGAAKLTQHVLDRTNNKIWVFAQSDRSQREVYLRELEKLYHADEESISWGWVPFENYDLMSRLWLCDLDETKVNYG